MCHFRRWEAPTYGVVSFYGLGNFIGWASQVALVVKNLPANAGDIRATGSIPVLERSLGGGHGNSLQYSCLENPMDRRAWWATVHRVTKSQTWLKRHSMHIISWANNRWEDYSNYFKEGAEISRDWATAGVLIFDGPPGNCHGACIT